MNLEGMREMILDNMIHSFSVDICALTTCFVYSFLMRQFKAPARGGGMPPDIQERMEKVRYHYSPLLNIIKHPYLIALSIR
jgi:hypothetical protein